MGEDRLKEGGARLNTMRKCRIAVAIRAYLNGDDLLPVDETMPQGDLDVAARAFDAISCDRCAMEKIAFAILVFDKGKSMRAAAEQCYISYSTAKRWKRQLVDLLDKWLPDPE